MQKKASGALRFDFAGTAQSGRIEPAKAFLAPIPGGIYDQL